MTPDNQTVAREIAANGLYAAKFRGIARSFRGGCLENLGGARMGKGHNNENRPFDIETACYLKPLFAAYNQAVKKRTRLFMVVMAGVKTVKSFSLEVCAADHVCNRNGDTAIYFGSGDVADDQSTTRILDYFKRIPHFQRKMETVKRRFDDTQGAIKFPDKTLRILSANIPNTQGLNLGFAGLCDAFVTANTGMIDQMIARTTQYGDAIVFLESQGGEKKFDFDRHYENTNQGELHVLCPHCAQSHIFNWKAFDEEAMTRPESFIPTPPLIIPSLDHAAWIDHHRPLMLADGRRVAGFQRGDSALIKREDGSYIEQAVIEQTHFRCFYCDGTWHDDGENGKTRVALDQSSHYVSANPNALADHIGFNFPQWINRRLTKDEKNGWGNMMLEKLQASETAEEFGNYELIKQWWQKKAARTWDDKLAQNRNLNRLTLGTHETDPEKLMPNSHCRQVTADCGKAEDAGPDESRIGLFWFDIWEWDKQSNGRQLSYGVVSSWELLAAQQRFWKVPSARTFIDCSWMPSQVEENAVKFFELIPPDGMRDGKPVPQIPFAWKLAAGAGQNRRLTVPGQNRGAAYSIDSVPGGPRKAHDAKGRLWRMLLRKLTWSNLWFEKQLDSILARGVSVQLEFLPRDKMMIVGLDGKPDAQLTSWSLDRCRDPLPNEKGKFASYQSQLGSRYFHEQSGKYIDYEKQSRPTEFRDTLLMQLAGLAPDSLLGHVGIDEKNL